MVPTNGIFATAVCVARISRSGIDTDETLQAPVLGRVAGEVSDIIAKSERVAVKHPQHDHHTHPRFGAHHDHVEHPLERTISP